MTLTGTDMVTVKASELCFCPRETTRGISGHKLTKQDADGEEASRSDSECLTNGHVWSYMKNRDVSGALQ